MKKFVFSVLVFLFFSFSANVYALNLITNGTFDDGLDSWSAIGDVTLGTDGYENMDGNYAILGATSNSGWPDKLEQYFSIESGTTSLTISFDLLVTGSDSAWGYDDDVAVILSTLQEYNWWIFEWDSWRGTTLYSWESENGSYTTEISFSGTVTVASNLVDDDDNGLISFILDEDGGLFCDKTYSALYVDNVVIDDGATATAPVPEPATLMLLGTGLIGIAGMSRKKMVRK